MYMILNGENSRRDQDRKTDRGKSPHRWSIKYCLQAHAAVYSKGWTLVTKSVLPITGGRGVGVPFSPSIL